MAGIVTLTTTPCRFLVLHNWDSTLWAGLAVYCAVRWLETSDWKWAFGVGSFVSCRFLFEQSKGAGLAIGLMAGFLIVRLTDRQRMLWGRGEIVWLGLGLAWPFIVTVVYFGAEHSLSPMLADWFWPLQHYSLANRVPYGYQNWSDSARQLMFGGGPWGVRLVAALTVSPCFLIPCFPLFALGLLAYWVIQTLRQRSPERKETRVFRLGQRRGVRPSALNRHCEGRHRSLHVSQSLILPGARLDG